MKRLLLLALLLFVTACSSRGDLNSDIDYIFDNEEIQTRVRKNNYAQFIEYYQPGDLYEMKSGLFSYVFDFNGSCLIMNINISGVINEDYYPEVVNGEEGFFDENKLVYSRYDTFNKFGNEVGYIYKIYQYEKEYLLYFVTDDLLFYGYCNENDVRALTEKILYLAKSAEVKKEEVVTMFSNKDVIDFEKKQVNLFETVMPVNGSLQEFLLDNSEEEIVQ